MPSLWLRWCAHYIVGEKEHDHGHWAWWEDDEVEFDQNYLRPTAVLCDTKSQDARLFDFRWWKRLLVASFCWPESNVKKPIWCAKDAGGAWRIWWGELAWRNLRRLEPAVPPSHQSLPLPMVDPAMTGFESPYSRSRGRRASSHWAGVAGRRLTRSLTRDFPPAVHLWC